MIVSDIMKKIGFCFTFKKYSEELAMEIYGKILLIVPQTTLLLKKKNDFAVVYYVSENIILTPQEYDVAERYDGKFTFTIKNESELIDYQKINKLQVKELQGIREFNAIFDLFTKKRQEKRIIEWAYNAYLEYDKDKIIKRVYTTKTKSMTETIMHVGFWLERIYESPAGNRYYDVRLGNESVILQKEDLMDFILIERNYSRKNKNQLFPILSTILFEEEKYKKLQIEKMYNAIGVFADENNNLIACYPGENVMLRGTNGYQENAIRMCEARGIDNNGELIELYYKIIELDIIPQNCLLMILGHSMIGTFFHVLKDILDVFPNFFWLSIPGIGKTTVMEIFYCFPFGSEVKNNDDIDSAPRLTQMATAFTSVLVIDDIDSLEDKVKSFLKSSSTRKKGRERLTKEQKLTSEETYTAYAGSGNGKNWLSKKDDEAFRDRCCINEEFKVVDEYDDNLSQFQDIRENLKTAKIVGPYLLKNAIEFVDKNIAGEINTKRKLEMYYKEKKKVLKKYLQNERVSLFSSRRLTIYTLIYIGLEFWNYTLQKKGFNSKLIADTLTLETGKLKEMANYYEEQGKEFTFEVVENVLQFFANTGKHDCYRNKENEIMLTTSFVNDYDDWARKRGYETLQNLSKLAEMITQLLREKIEAKSQRIKKIEQGTLDSHHIKYSIIFPIEKIQAKLGIDIKKQITENKSESSNDLFKIDRYKINIDDPEFWDES